jgi:hypothetical protein
VLVDQAGLNAGSLTRGLRFGGVTSGEGVASTRTSGVNQNGLDLPKRQRPDSESPPVPAAVDLALSYAWSRQAQASCGHNRELRTFAGTDWTTTALVIGMDVDNTVREGRVGMNDQSQVPRTAG